MSMRMIQKVFGFFGAKGGNRAHAEARRRGEERGMDFHHQTIQLSNHQTELSHTEARRHGEEREMNFRHQTIQLSNHQTELSHAEARRDGGAEMEKVVSRCGRRSSRGGEFLLAGSGSGAGGDAEAPAAQGRRKKGGGQRANGPTIQRSNGQTVLRGRRFAAPWARAAAVAAVAGGMWLGCGLESAWGAFWDSWFGGGEKTVETVEAVETVADGAATAEPVGTRGRGARAYSGTGTFTKITSLSALQDGDYVVIVTTASAGKAMSDTTKGTSWLYPATVTISGSSIVNPSKSAVFLVKANATYGGYTLENQNSTGYYVSWPTTGNNGGLKNSISAKECWTFSVSSSQWQLNNVNTTTRIMRFNSTGWRAYTSSTGTATHDIYRYRASSVVAPTVTTPTSADVAATSATLGGNVTADGGATVTERGVVYSLSTQSGDPTVGGTGCTKVTASAGGTGVFTVSVTGLSGSTAYKFRAYAKNSAGTSYSSVGTFTTPAPGADCWISLETSANGTYYVGDSLASGWWVNWQVNGSWDEGWMKTWVGWQTSGDGYTEYTASWYEDDGSNKKVHSDIGGYTFKVAQPHYIIAQGQRTASGPAAADATPGTSWTDSSAWPPDGLNTGTAHFTVNAIPVPASMSAAPGDAAGKVQLSWAKNTAGHNVMVVRYASGATPTAPTDGTAYAQNASIGSGKVVYNGSGTSYGNTGLTGGTTYDYYFYSVNNNYYSAETKKSATAAKAPSFATASVTKSTTVGTAVSNTQTASGTPSTMTYSVTCTSGGAASSTYSVNSSGVFNFTPAAAGTFVFTVSASNGVGSAATYTITVTVAPVAPTLTLSGQTAVSVSGTVGCMSGATVNLRRYATSADASGDSTGTAGTAVSVTGTGTSRTFTDSGLDSCTTYYYKAWQTSGGQTSAASDVKNRTTDGPAAPDVTPSGAGGEITLNWSAVPGAVSYKVNVCEVASAGTSSRGGAADGTAAAKRVGRRGATSWTVTLSGGTYDTDHITWTDGKATITQEKWGGTTAVSSSYISAPRVYRYHALVLDAGEGNRWTSVSYTVSGTYFGNSIAWGSSDSAITSANYTSATAGGGEPTYSSGATSTLTFSGGRYAYIYNAGTGSNVQLRPTAITATYEPAQSCVATDVSVTGTSVTFDAEDGVETGKTYSWSVVSVGAGGCESAEESGEIEVSAEPAPAVGVTVDGDAVASGGTVGWGTVEIAGGAVTKTFTVENTGDAALSSLGNPSVTAGQGFTVSAMGAGSLVAGGTTTFTVTFTPAAAMSAGVTKEATVSFAHGAEGSPFSFTVTAAVPAAAVESTKASLSGLIATVGYVGSNTKQMAVSGSHLTGAAVTVTLSDTATWEIRKGTSGTWVSGPLSLTPSSGTLASTVVQVRLKNGATAGAKTGTLTIAGGGASASVVVNLSGTVYPMPSVSPASASVTIGTGDDVYLDFSDYHTGTVADYTYTLEASSGLTEDEHYLFDSGSGMDGQASSGPGDIWFALPPSAGTYVFTVTVQNRDTTARTATFTWTVVVADAPGVTKGTVSTSGTGATVPATVNAGGAATTVSFVYGTTESYGTAGTVTGGSVAAGETAAAVSVSLTGLTQGQTYYYKWTAVNAGGTTEVTGSFFLPGDGLEFPGGMNGWTQSGTTTRDAEFGTAAGPYYYTPAYQLAANAHPTFKEYKAGTWYGASATRYVNGADCHYTETDTNGGNNTMGSDYAGYYTWRGRHTGSGVEYVILYTEGAPVTITSVTDNHAARGTASVTVTATLSAVPSSSEKVYVRYKVGSGSFELHEMGVSGTTATYTIPGQGKGTLVEYYILTSPHAYVGTDPDLCTLRGQKSGTTNFAYSATILPPTVTSATPGYEKVSLAWNLNAAGDAVMVIRYAGTSPTITAPTDGTAYAADTSALGGTVVYGAYAHPSGSATLDNAVSQGTGYTYVFYSVKNNKYSEGVVRTATTESLATPTVGVTTAGAGTLTGADAGKGEIYVVARITGSGSFSGNPSGAAPNAGQSLCGGTVVYKGTAGSFSVADMEGCQTYKYKAWLHAADENAWSAGSTVATVSMPTPAAPVLNALSDVTYQGFTASWNAVPGAVTYRMDIVKGGGTGAAVLSADFADAGLSTENSYPSGEQTRTFAGQTWLTTAVMTKPEGTSNGAGSTGFLQMQANNGIIVLPTLNGVKTVKVVARGTNALKLQRKVNGAWDTDHPLETWTLTSTGTEYTHTFESVQDGISLRIVGDTANAKYVHDVTVLGEGTTPVAGWTDKDVGSLMTVSGGVVSVVVEELDELTTYSVTVRAEGATAACASGDSNTQSATTLENTSVTTVTISDADGAGNDSAVAAGGVLAGQTAVLQGTKLTVASGTVNPTLLGVVFTTSGTATGSDVTTFQVRVGTSATFAGTETVKGTVAGGASGSHTVTFGSAQTLTAGQTYYVWIEAVTAAGATAGNTVAVGALTKDAFTMTGARKNGNTGAAGTKTIYGAPTVSLTPGASGSATISGTVGGLAGGATVELRRYTSAEDAAGDTAGTAGTAVTVTGGAFSATGLEACRPYWFKARQTLDGFTGAWGAAQTAAAPGLTAPTGLSGTATGAHSATLSWDAAAGALGYSVNVWHFEGGSGSETKTDELTIETLGVTSVNAYSGFSGVQAADGSDAVYAGEVAKASSDNGSGIQQNAKSGNERGIWTTTSGGTLKSVSVDWFKNANSYKVYGKTSGTFDGTSTSGATQIGTLTYASPSTGDISESGYVAVLIVPSGGASYANSITIEWDASGTGTRVDDVTANATASGATATCTVGGTGATLGNLTDNTTYYWSVAATGFGGCAGDGATGPAFKTDELLGAPTIVEPLTAGVEQLGGAITGAAGATMILKRYESEDAAMAATADGSLGGVVVSTTPGTGSAAGTWTFADTGLDGCKTYYYRAWQKATVDGEQATSSGSNVASGKTQPGLPVLTAVGAGSQMTISWAPVPGAVSYYLELASDDQFSRPTSGDPVLTEDFAGFTGSSEVSDLDAKTSTTGWSGNKVYAGAGSARLGTSSSAGYLTTPRIAAQSGGGTVYFDLKQWKEGEGASVTVQISYPEAEGEDEEWIDVKTVTPTAEFDTYSVSLPAGAKTSDFWICFDTVAAKRVYIDNVRVVPLSSGSTGSLKYESTVTGAPYERTADGLEVGQTYYYQVTTTYGEGCETVTPIGSALTADAPIIQVTPMHYNFGTVNKNEGGATATFTVRNTGSIALKFNAATLVQDGDAYSITSPTGSALTADLPAGQSRTYTVKFDPQVSGTRTATLRFGSDAFNVTGEVPPASGTPTFGNLDIPLTGTCYDPATADPTVYWLKVEDELGIEDTVTDQSMAHENDKPVLTVLTWHYNRSYRTLDRSSKATKWTLYDPNGDVVVTSGGTRLENQFFTAVEEYVYDGKTCAKFSAPIPALGTGKAVRGTYTVKVKVYDSTGTYWTETTHFVPIETGWLFDDFTRADREATGSGALENGWTAMTSGGAVAGEAAIHADALELYGANGECPGVAGRIAVARDMSDVGYATDPHDFVGTGSWGFHFKTGAKTVGFGDGSTAGAFVLGSTASTWLTATPGQVGYAVAMRDDAVQLVKFEGSLLAGGTITQLGEAQFSGAQGKLLAVRVDFLPGQDEVDADAADDGVHHDAVPAKYRLYVKEVAKTGGSPIAECTAADKVLEYEFPVPEDHNLRYAGMMWNHGVAQVSDKTGAMFDDIYLPHMEGQTEPMKFHVIDEDTEGPEFYGISLRGAVAAPDVAAHGLTVTGMVHDASGVVGNVAWAMYNGETLLTSGTATPAAVSGSTTEHTLSCTIPAGAIDGSIRSADCRFVLTATDGDDDRSENGVNIDSSEGTGSFPFTLCASTPAAPAWATAEADGAEMVVLRWARAAAGTQYIVVRSDEEIGDNASPQGRTETMAEGTTVEGWGTVVYNGTGDNHLSGTWTAREFVVAPGSANYFAVYGMTGDAGTGYYFSAPTKPNAYKWETTDEGTGETTVHTAVDGSGVPVASSVAEGGWPCTTAKYEPGEGVDAFAYRTSVPEIGDTDPQLLALAFNYETRPETGSGWGGPWTGDVGTWKVHDGSLLSEGTHYPAPTGNKLYWHDTSHEESTSTEVKLTRPLKTPDSGEFYMAALMNYYEPNPETGAEGKWIQIALVDASGNDIVSFGMPGWDHNVAAIEYNGGQYCGAENIESDGYHLYSGHGNDYVVVGQLSREDHRFRMWAYWGGSGNTTTIPELYSKKDNGVEVSVSVERTALNTVLADFDFGENTTLPPVAGIQLRAGSASGKELGHVYFDEVRFANTWEELFLFNAPEVYTFDFDKPEEGTGIMVGLDDEGHRMWEISDGALAHGNVGLNAQFGLYHRTGIKAASFTILDKDGNYILKSASDLAPESGGTLASVPLSGILNRSYSDWKTPEHGATGVAVPTNKISLDETYTVEVMLKSTGGKEAVVTAASESGGAGSDELFFGEYGENTGYDNYLELYNGTGHTIDLRDYWIAKLNNVTDPEAILTKFADPSNWAINNNAGRIGAGTVAALSGDSVVSMTEGTSTAWPEGPFMLPHRATVCIVPNNAGTAFVKALLGNDCRVIKISQSPMAVSGDDPQMLLYKEGATQASELAGCEWIDMAGLTKPGRPPIDGDEGQYIMYRLESTVEVPRRYPKVVDWDEWDYRDWTAEDKVEPNAWSNLLATAGAYDKNIGLGGNMEFKVFDDDIEPPELVRGGVRVRKTDGTLEEEYRAVSAGDRTYVVGGWSFTNMPAGVEVADLTLEQYQKIAEMWTGGLTQNGGLSWASELGGTDLAGWANVIEAGNNKGQSNVEFDGITQRKYGAMIARAASVSAQGDEVWLGFDLDVAQLTDGMLTFGYAGGNAGFKNAYVAWSATGEEGSFKMPNEWNFDPNSGGASTWSEWSRSLDAESTGIPASAGHLWFRVYLSEYGSAAGTFRMDNMRVEGAPSVVRVTDAEICNRGMQFEVHVKDEASGLDAGATGAQSSDDGKAYFDCGLGTTDKYRTVSLVNGGKSESTITWTAASGGAPVTTGWGPLMAQNWYESTQAGHGKLRLSVPDADDDRADDQTMLRSDFGMLMVEDDDEAPPVLDMATMKPRQEGTMAEWLLVEKTTVASETMDALAVGTLGLNTTEGTTSRPRYSLRTAADTGLSSPTYAVYQSGWQAESKFWTVRLKNTTAGAGTITKISFAGQVGSVLAPTGYTVKYGTVTAGEFDGEESTTWSGSLLTSGTAWVKEGATEGTTGSPIKTWANYEKTVSIPLAASGTSGDEIELRIYGTGTDPKGIGATWYLWDLKIEGEISVPGEGGEDGYTYVTDASLAQPGGANLPMSGSVYDEGSGLGAVPTYELKRGNKTVSSGEITFKAARDLSARTSKELGEFEQNIAVSGLGYADLALAEYKGTVHATDADHDREDAGGNNMDHLNLDGQFAFTVVDQDLVGPTAPANVTVNGTAVVPGEPPNRLTVTWTNNPEFLVSFDVAEDVVPTAENLADATWLAEHGVEAASVKKASLQTGAAGIGEYRVSLTTTPAALSNAPAFSVAVAEGAVANYGFERTSEALQAWRLTDTAGIRAAGDRAFPGSTTVAPAPCEGRNSLFVPSGNVGGTGGGGAIGAPQSQVILFENTAHVAPKVGGSFWYYKVKNTSSPRVRISAYPNENMVAEERIAFRVVNPSTGSTSAGEWHQATFEFEAIGDGNANCILLELYSGNDYSFFDDVRIGVDVGTGNLPTMRYVATGPEAQGLNAKHLFAVDADNNRAQDRMVGATAAFYTAYDITPPTPVAFKSHGKGASTDQVDDPTTQFDLTWFSNDIGPDDPDDANYQTGWSGKEVLSPWGTYRVYYTTYDPVDMEDKASKAGKSTETYLYETLIEGTDDQGRPKYHGAGWKHVENGAEIEDVTAPAVGGKRKYSGWDQITKDANNQQTVRLYDLDFDQEYVVVVVGVDKAGNEGPVNSSSWATNNTIKFSLTRGWHVPKAEAVTALEGRVSDIGQRLTNTVVSALEWTAAGMTRNAETGEMEGEATKDYDLLQWDARYFRESPDNEWKLLQTVKTNWFVDDGGPTNRGSIRFYRASYKDRWKKAVTNATTGQVTAQTPLVSEEVYAQTAVRLRPGQNFTALHGVPYTNTFRGVFGGLDEFPGGNTSADGTVIDFYEPQATETKTESYWLHQSGNWLREGDEWQEAGEGQEGGEGQAGGAPKPKPVNDIVQDRNFFTRAFSIQLPNTIPDKYVAGVQTIMHGAKPEEVPYLLWKPIAQVPTNGFSRVVECGTAKAPKYNIVALRLPVATHPSKMNLLESGFAQGYPWEADQIYTIDTLTREPGHSCYCDPEGNWQYVAGGNVPWDYFKPNDVLVIVSKNKPFGDETSTSTSWTWTYDPKKFYTLPNRHMQAE